MPKDQGPEFADIEKLIREVSNMFRGPNSVRSHTYVRDNPAARDLEQRAHVLLARVSDEQIALVSSLWSFVHEITAGVVPQEDLDLLGPFSPDRMYKALLCVARHPNVLRDAAYIVLAEHRHNRSLSRRPSSSFLSHDSISILVIVGTLLGLVEGRDPNMQITRPGIRAHIDQSSYDNVISGLDMIRSINATIDRIMQPVESKTRA